MFQSVFNVLGETLARLHQDEEAERWYQAALNAQPDHVPAHITYGKLLAKNVSRKSFLNLKCVPSPSLLLILRAWLLLISSYVEKFNFGS